MWWHFPTAKLQQPDNSGLFLIKNVSEWNIVLFYLFLEIGLCFFSTLRIQSALGTTGCHCYEFKNVKVYIKRKLLKIMVWINNLLQCFLFYTHISTHTMMLFNLMRHQCLSKHIKETQKPFTEASLTHWNPQCKQWLTVESCITSKVLFIQMLMSVRSEWYFSHEFHHCITVLTE